MTPWQIQRSLSAVVRTLALNVTEGRREGEGAPITTLGRTIGQREREREEGMEWNGGLTNLYKKREE